MTHSLYVAYDEDHVILNEVKNLDDRDEITMRCFTSFNMTMCFLDRRR